MVSSESADGPLRTIRMHSPDFRNAEIRTPSDVCSSLLDQDSRDAFIGSWQREVNRKRGAGLCDQRA
jgi:hypothetical protein